MQVDEQSLTERKKSKISFSICLDERTVAYHNVSHAQRSTITWSQSAEILNELEHADITANQESTAHRSSSPGAPLLIINHQNEMKANSSKNLAEPDPENTGVKLESVTSQSLESNIKLNSLHSLQHHNSTLMESAMPSQNFTKGSVREEQHSSSKVPRGNIQQQTIADDDKPFPVEVIKEEDAHRHQIDDKSIFNNTQNNASLMMISSASQSQIAPGQEAKMDTEIKSTHRDISTPMSFSEWKRGNLTLLEKQSQTVQKIDVSQIHQQNELLKQNSQIAKQSVTNFIATQNSKTSNNAQTTSLPQAEITELLMARTMMNSHENEPKKGMENLVTNETLINNSTFDNFFANDHKISVDQYGGKLLANEIATTINSFSPKSEAKNELHMQLNNANDSLKGNKNMNNNSNCEKTDSQFVNTQFSYKENDNAIAVARDVGLTQRNHVPVLRHRMRTINRGSVQQPSSSDDSLPALSVSMLSILSSTISSLSRSPSITSSSSTSLPPSLLSSLIPSDTKLVYSRISDKNESFNGKLIALQYSVITQ